MNLFIRRVFGFLVYFISVVLILVIIISPFDNIDKHKSTNTNIITLQTKLQFDSLDVLFLGNSYFYSAIQPEILDKYDIKSFNLSVASAGVGFYKLITADYLQHVETYPKKIFVLLSPMTFSSKSDNSKLYPIHRYLEKPISNIEFAIIHHRLSYLFPLYKNSISKGINNIFSLTKNIDVSDQINKRGFVENSEIITPDGIIKNEYLYTPLLNDSFDFLKINEIKDFVISLEKLDIDVIYLELPTNLLENFFNDDYLSAYSQSLIELEKTNLIYSISDSLFSTENFRNIDHMNTRGSIITSNQVGKYLNEMKD